MDYVPPLSYYGLSTSQLLWVMYLLPVTMGYVPPPSYYGLSLSSQLPVKREFWKCYLEG